VQTKITPEIAQSMADAHADGVSFRTLGRLYDIAPSLAHRHVHRVNGTTEPVETGAAVERPTESDAEAGASKPAPRPSRQHVETEFPGHVAGYEVEQEAEPLIITPPPPLPPERAPGQHAKSTMHSLDWAEHNLRTVAIDIAQCRRAGLDDKLAQYEEKQRTLQGFIDTWADAYAGLTFGRPSYRVKVSEHTLRDGPPPALWDNPYSPPSGTLVVGS
jgi:hypothetical protein